MAYYYSIPIEEMEEELESLRFYPVNLVFRNKPVKEWVYERKLPRSPNHFVRIYTGIQRYGKSAGESRKAGKDAIRIQVIYRDAKGETLVSQTKRVHRVGGWRKNLHKRMDEVATELPQVEFDSRGEPMTLRKKGKNQFWGSRDYPKFKETKPFRAEDDNEVHEINSLQELEAVLTERNWRNFKPLLKINFSGVYAVRIIDGPSQVIYGRNMLCNLETATNYQHSTPLQPDIDESIEKGKNYHSLMRSVSLELPVVAISKNATLDGLIKSKEGFTSWKGRERESRRNLMIIDLEGVVFLNDAGPRASVSGWRTRAVDAMLKYGWKPVATNGEIEIIGGVPEENVVYQEIKPNYSPYLTIQNRELAKSFRAEGGNQVIRFNGEMSEYADKNTDDSFTSMSNLAHISLPDYEESYYWTSADGNSRATVAYDEENGVILIPNFEVSLHMRGKKMAHKYLEELIDDAYLDGYSVQVIDVDNHAIGFWEKMQSQGLIEGWSKGSFAAEEIRCCKECDKTTGLTTIQTGTYCYDCLPINLGAEDNYEATYGLEQAKIRRKLKNKIKKQAIMGTKAGQWSARKSQELKRQYEAACDKKGLNPYKGKKTKSQDNLSKWSKQKWGTASGRKSSVTGEPYFPAKAVAALKKKDLYSKAKRQKAQATRAGKQNARYSDDIRKVVAQYRAEGEDIVIADFKNMSAAEIQTYAPDNWKIVMYWAADGSTYILRRIFKPESYGAAVDLVDEINIIASELNHHPMVTFDKERVMVQLWTHDVHNITELDIAFAELLNQFADKWELNAESPDWEDIDWKTDEPPAKKGPEDWGDDVEWDAEDDEITLKEFDETTADDFVDDSDDRIALMLRKKSKINRHGDIGCPVCGSIGLFYEEIIAKGKKWYCYNCLYEDKEESIKGKGDITLEKYGLEITCPICKKAVKAFNNDSMLRHMKKCGVPK